MLQISTLTPADWQRLQILRLRALRDTPDAFWSTAYEEAELTPAQWRERLERTDMATVVVVNEGRDVGLAAGMPHYDDPSDAALVGLWVAAEARVVRPPAAPGVFCRRGTTSRNTSWPSTCRCRARDRRCGGRRSRVASGGRFC